MKNTFTFISNFFPMDCSNQTEIVLLIYLGYKVPYRAIPQSLLPFIKQNNYKIIFFKQKATYSNKNYDATFLLIKKKLQAYQKIKIIFLSHFFDIKDCDRLMKMLQQLKLMQLPFSQNNVGLILIENGETEEWKNGKDKFDLDLFPQTEFIYVLYGMAWDHCMDMSYKWLKCEKYGCSTLKIIINKDTENQFTNILLVKMTSSGQLLSDGEKLKEFINDRLQFTSLTAHDVQFFQPVIFEKLQQYHHHQKELYFQQAKDYREATVPLISETSNVTILSDIFSDEDKYIKYLYNYYHPLTKSRSKRQSTEGLVVTEALYDKLLICAPTLGNRSDRFSVKIRNAILKILNKITEEYDKKSYQIICENSDILEAIQSGRVTLQQNEMFNWALDYVSRQERNLVNFASASHLLFMDSYAINRAHEDLALDLATTLRKQAIKLVQMICENILQHLFADFTIDLHSQTESIEEAVDRVARKLKQWVDESPISNNDTITWDEFSIWTGIKAILASDINVDEAKDLFEFSQTKTAKLFWEFQHKIPTADLHLKIRESLFVFNKNVTTVAIQQLATSKLERVDAVVAMLDQSFMAGIRNLHQSVTREQWITIRPQIFYYLHRVQQNGQTFDNFLLGVRRMFDIHYIDMPMTSYESLQTVKAEFDVYQEQLGGYINGSINTEQQWGRKFHVATEYIFKNFGTQHKSVINGAVKWIKGELVFKQPPALSGYDFGGTLVFVNLIMQKKFKRRRNFW